MAEGYLARSATNTEGMTLEAMLFCKTNIAGYFFDGFINVDVASELVITENPVETGSSVVDHSYVKPIEITMQVMMSDVHQSIIPGQFSGGWSRSMTAYKLLKELQSKRIPFSVLCRLGMFENMLLRRVQAADNAETYQGLMAEVTLSEIPMARVKVVELSLTSQTTIKTEMGKLQAVDASDKEKESILYMLGFGAGANQQSGGAAGFSAGMRLSASARDLLVDVAKREIGVSEPYGDDKYISWYNNATKAGFNTSVSWCAIFVSWCARHAGIPASGLPNFSYVATSMNTAKSNQTWRNKFNYVPRTGDVIIFQRPANMHTGIVEKTSGSTVYTIEGNTGSPGSVKRRSYSMQDAQILGYINWDMS